MSNPDVSNQSVDAVSAEQVAPTPKVPVGKNYGKAFAWGFIWLVGLSLIFTLIYRNFSAEGFGRFLAMTMIASGITGWTANRGAVARSFTKVGGIYFLVLLAVWVISSFGPMQRG